MTAAAQPVFPPRSRVRPGKPTTTERGYGNLHQALRRKIAPIVAAGQARCARCGKPIIPGQPWDLGHVDGDRNRYAGPEHRSCNRATSQHRAELRKPPSRTSRSW